MEDNSLDLELFDKNFNRIYYWSKNQCVQILKRIKPFNLVKRPYVLVVNYKIKESFLEFEDAKQEAIKIKEEMKNLEPKLNWTTPDDSYCYTYFKTNDRVIEVVIQKVKQIPQLRRGNHYLFIDGFYIKSFYNFDSAKEEAEIIVEELIRKSI